MNHLRGVFYGWWLAIISALVLVTTIVPLFNAMSVWAVALETRFGWTRTQLGLALSFTRVEGGLMGAVEGYLSDRLGTRVMVFTGLLIFCGGFLLFSQVQNLWMFYLAFVVMSLGHGLGGWVPVMTLLNHWFTRHRGMAMGTAMMGTGAGSLVVVPAIAWAIDPDHDRLGWRLTATVVAGVALVAAFTLPRMIRNRPQDYGLRPDGDPPNPTPTTVADRMPGSTTRDDGGQAEPGFTTRQALRTPAFWFISFGHGFGAMVILAIMSHLALVMKDDGYGLQTAAWVVSVYTGVQMVFQLVGGYIGDRIPKNVALFIFTTIQGAAVILPTISSSLAGYFIFAVVFGIGFGGRTPLTTAIRGEYFGRASFGKILGISTVPMNILLLTASPLAGYMRDQLGDYDLAFRTLAVLTFIGAVLFLLAKRPRLPAATSQAQVI
jgi:MFS family permease